MPTRPTVPDHLIVLLQGRVAGTLRPSGRAGALAFVYDAAWRADRDAFPISLSMPLAGPSYEGEAVAYYLRALLPDSEARLNAIAHRVGVSPDDPFALLAHVGKDCPGAVQFVRPERLHEVEGKGRGAVHWLSETEVAHTLRDLSRGNAAGADATATGQFSLPGALAKVALVWDPRNSRWGLPSGRAASTHIIKPPLRGVKFHNENEYLCLELARATGNDAARAFILRAEEQTAIAVERFDRQRRGRDVIRLHQEDLSQALGVNPRLKYAAEGAPGIVEGVRLLREYATTDDVYAFIRAIAFNWIIGGTDAHPRNYSILIGQGGTVSLAPLYDLASGLLLPTRMSADELPFAMRVAGKSTLGAIQWRDWADQARMLKLNPARVTDQIADVNLRVLESSPHLTEAATAQHIDARFVERFVARIRTRAKQLAVARATP